MKKDARIICRGCGTETEEKQDKCAVCGKSLYAERIEKYMSNMPKNNAGKKFSFLSFLKDTSYLFTIAGVFGALSYYLTNLIPKNGNTDITASASYILMDPTVALQLGIVVSYCLFFIFILGIISELMSYEESILKWGLTYLLFFLILSALVYLVNTYLVIISVFVILITIIGIMLVDRLLCISIFSDNLVPKRVKARRLIYLLIGNLIPTAFLIAFRIYENHPTIVVWSIVTALSWGLSLGSLQVLVVVIDNLIDLSKYRQSLLERLKI